MSAPTASPPRIYVLTAERAPVAAVFRRGPAEWWHIGRWDLAAGTYEAGAWFRGRIYPRRCDLSPDGQLLYAFMCKFSRREFMGRTDFHDVSLVSKLPWLFALAAWKEMGSWTRGCHFVIGKGPSSIGDAEHGDAGPIAERFGLSLVNNQNVQYATERRRGWLEHEHCPARIASDAWDEQRQVMLQKPRPRTSGKKLERLVLVDHGWSTRGLGRIEGRRPTYRLESRAGVVELDALWADWDSVGRLLLATPAGLLQIRSAADFTVIERSVDLSSLTPAPRQAPKHAQAW